MESKVGMATSRDYQDFEPSMEWVPEDDSETLLLYLPGFAKEQLRVQLRSRNLIISGERKLQQNTWSRFRVEFPVSANCDLNKISAKFEGNILFVRQPKLMSVAVAPKPQEESPVEPKTVVSKPTPTTSPISQMENKEMEKDPKTGLLEEKRDEKIQEKGRDESQTNNKQGVNEDGSEKKTSNMDNRNKKVVAYGELDKTAKTALDNYKQAVGVFAAKLKTSRIAVNTIVILLIGLVLGVYITSSIKLWTN